ncbi:MAG: EF2563 family selenium-dependent molybdenum hydroxylase system protein [Oligoflexales bacterium]|nr:EF2563 family selenium-dependent molybdenum hydroxylase system protein [Oligoflexales bacterium]
MLRDLVMVRGGGDIASGIIHRLWNSGFRIAVLEIEQPTVVRRTVSFAQAVFDGHMVVEGVASIKIESAGDILGTIDTGKIPVLIDERAFSIDKLKPDVLVDAILAKQNIGTHIKMANIVIGVGPGFCAGVDVHAVIETNRGHNLGRVIYEGRAEPNTAVPGEIHGYAMERLIRSPSAGIIRHAAKIGDIIKKGDPVAYVGDTPVCAQIDGVLRGLMEKGIKVEKNEKVGDVDPRCNPQHCYTISDKARSIGGGVLEAVMHLGAVRK